MIKEDIGTASVHAIRKHYGCVGKHPCSDLENCRFCSGKNLAYDCNECGADEFNEGFIIGANWRINSIWHNAKEKPIKTGWFLVRFNQNIFDQPEVEVWPIGNEAILSWEDFIEINFVAEYAYIEDLLPNKENTK